MVKHETMRAIVSNPKPCQHLLVHPSNQIPKWVNILSSRSIASNCCRGYQVGHQPLASVIKIGVPVKHVPTVCSWSGYNQASCLKHCIRRCAIFISLLYNQCHCIRGDIGINRTSIIVLYLQSYLQSSPHSVCSGRGINRNGFKEKSFKSCMCKFD